MPPPAPTDPRRVLSRAEARRIDQQAQQRLCLPGDLLMENAGIRAAAHILALAAGLARSRVVVIAGPGNNGGDGFVIARQLQDALAVEVLLVGDPAQIGGDAALNLVRLRALRVEPQVITDAAQVTQCLSRGEPPVVVDALFGTGLSREIVGLPRAVIAAINSAGHPVVAIDLPSGLDCDTGEVLGDAVRADLTVTFIARKLGFDRGHGGALCGRVEVASIGFPPAALLVDLGEG